MTEYLSSELSYCWEEYNFNSEAYIIAYYRCTLSMQQ